MFYRAPRAPLTCCAHDYRTGYSDEVYFVREFKKHFGVPPKKYRKLLLAKESPLGRAVMGHAVGDRVKVEVNETKSYFAMIRAIEKGEDNEDLPISAY